MCHSDVNVCYNHNNYLVIKILDKVTMGLNVLIECVNYVYNYTEFIVEAFILQFSLGSHEHTASYWNQNA